MKKLELVGLKSKFDKYNLEIQEMLGSGNFGVIFICIDLDDKKMYPFLFLKILFYDQKYLKKCYFKFLEKPLKY